MKALIVTLLTFILLLIIFYIRIKEQFDVKKPFDVKEIQGHINYLNYLSQNLDHKVASFPK
jgi:hypothetical protein